NSQVLGHSPASRAAAQSIEHTCPFPAGWTNILIFKFFDWFCMEVVQDLCRIESVIIADDLAAVSACLHTLILRQIQGLHHNICHLINFVQPIDEISTRLMHSGGNGMLIIADSNPSTEAFAVVWQRRYEVPAAISMPKRQRYVALFSIC
ncbi:MAG: hypothetical protein WC883_09715, partial [Smithellaceae bacterium]